MESLTNQYISLIKEKINFISKDEAVSFVLIRDYTKNSKITKTDAIKLIIDNLDDKLALEILNEFKSKIGYTAAEVQEILSIDNKERLKMAKQGFLKISGYYEVRQYGKYLDCPIYEPIHILNITKEDIEQFRSTVKPATKKQLEALEKARSKQIENRTCKKCGSIERNKKDLYSNGLCEYCFNEEKAKNKRKEWIKNKEKYVVLDTETTGLDDNDEIIEIGILDLDGNVLFESLVKPSKEISPEATAVNGISNNDVSKAPMWTEIWSDILDIIEHKIILAYNSDFDIAMINQSCRLYGIQAPKLKHECLMENVMILHNTDRWISLQEAVGGEYQSHRAVEDCKMNLKIISDID